MDPSTASYYRALLFVDGQDARPLPPTLVKLHGWAQKRNGALGLGGMITKAVALTVFMCWMSTTKEGREFTREFTNLGDMFGDDLETDLAEDLEDETEDSEPPLSIDEWDSLPAESDVTVTLKDKSTAQGKFIARHGSWVDVRVDGDIKSFRISKVQVVGA